MNYLSAESTLYYLPIIFAYSYYVSHISYSVKNENKKYEGYNNCVTKNIYD